MYQQDVNQDAAKVLYMRVTLFNISVDQFFFLDKDTEKNTQRCQLDALAWKSFSSHFLSFPPHFFNPILPNRLPSFIVKNIYPGSGMERRLRKGRFMDKMIEVDGLKKYYGDVRAVDGISFYVEKGRLFSFLGPNGAGKSTTIDILCTLADFQGGACAVGGYDLRRDGEKIRRIIGIVFQDHMLDGLLTVRENLFVRAALYTSNKSAVRKAVGEAVKAAELDEIIDRPYGKLSGGQRRRADIARALVQKPEILFLDEPTTGLDPQTRCNIWNMIKKLQSENGMTVFLTTHYMEEAAESDYVIVIDHCRIAAQGTPTELKTRYSSDTLKLYAADMEALAGALDAMALSYTCAAGECVVKLPDTLAALRILEKCKPHINAFEVLQGTMDDAFIGITGKELRQ
jgi:multidrug/hemolysin transport system ATP-binding protein